MPIQSFPCKWMSFQCIRMLFWIHFSKYQIDKIPFGAQIKVIIWLICNNFGLSHRLVSLNTLHSWHHCKLEHVLYIYMCWYIYIWRSLRRNDDSLFRLNQTETNSPFLRNKCILNPSQWDVCQCCLNCYGRFATYSNYKTCNYEHVYGELNLEAHGISAAKGLNTILTSYMF